MKQESAKEGCKDFNHTSNIKFHCWTSTTQPKCAEKGENYWTSCFSQWDNWQAHQCKNKETSPTSCSAQSKVWVTLGQFDSTNKNGSFRSHQISKSNEPVFIPLVSPEFLSKLNIMGGGWSTPIIKIFYSLFSRLQFLVSKKAPCKLTRIQVILSPHSNVKHPITILNKY